MQWVIIGVYVLIVWLIFAKLKLIRMSFSVMLLLASVGPIFLIYLLVMMNFYHPGSSDAREIRRLLEITPRITTPGRVQEVVAKPRTHLKKGDVLFKIDPTPFEFEVKRLEAALAEAQQSVKETKAALDQAAAARSRAQAQLDLAQKDYDRQTELLKQEVVPQATVDTAQRNFDSAKQSLAEAEAAEERTKLAYESNIGDVNTTVAQVEQQLLSARNNLSETTVTAPSDGYVTNISLVPGAIVSSSQSVMPFICDQSDEDMGRVVLTFDQGAFLAVKEGDYAEVVFPMYPGRVFTGKVVSTLDVSNYGLIAPSGTVPTLSKERARFSAVVQLDEKNLRLPAGAQGEGAVYTGKAQIAGTFRMGILRTDTVLNFLKWGG